MDKKHIEELLMKGTLTREERAEIRSEAEKRGISVKVKQGCRTCYEKLLTALYESENPKAAVSIDGYMLRNVNAAFRVFGSQVVYSNATIGDMEVGNLPPAVLSAHFVKSYTGEETETEQTWEE